MSWFAWVAVIFGGLVALDIVFVGVVVTIDIINDWRWRREKRRSGSGDH